MARKLSPIAAQITLDLNKWTAGVRQFQRDGKAIQASLKPVAELTKNVGAVFAAVGSAVGGSLLLMAKKAADYGDAMLDASQKTGISTKQLSALRLVAQQSGSSFEGITAGATKLSLSLFEAGTKGGDAAKVFTALGISVKDSTGRIRDASDVLPQIADRFATMKDGAEKTAIAVKLFGKAGADMIPVLNNGADGFRRAAEMVEKYNLETADGGRLGDEFNDNMAETGIAVQGLANQLGAALLPGMIKLVQIGNNVIAMVSRWAKEHPGLTRAIAATAAMMSGAGGLLLGMSAFARFAPGMIANLKLMSTAFMGLSIPMRAVIVGLTLLTAAFIAFPQIRGPVLDTLQALYKGMALVVSAIVNLGEALGNLTGRALTGDVMGALGELKKLREIPADITSDVLAAEARFKGFVGGISAGIKDMNAALNMKPANMPDFEGMGVDLDAFGKTAKDSADELDRWDDALRRGFDDAVKLSNSLGVMEAHQISASIITAKFGDEIKAAANEFRLWGLEVPPLLAKYEEIIDAKGRLAKITEETTAKFEKERELLRDLSEVPIVGGGMTPALEAIKAQGAFAGRVREATENLQRQRDEVADLSKQIVELNRRNMSARDIENALGVSIADVTRRAKELGVQIDPLTKKLGQQEEATRNLTEAWGSTFANLSDRLVDMVVDFDFSFKRLVDIAKDTAKSLMRSFLDGFFKPFKDQLAGLGESLAGALSGVLFGGGGGAKGGVSGAISNVLGMGGQGGLLGKVPGLGAIFGGGSAAAGLAVPLAGSAAATSALASSLALPEALAAITPLAGPAGTGAAGTGGAVAGGFLSAAAPFLPVAGAAVAGATAIFSNQMKDVADRWTPRQTQFDTAFAKTPDTEKAKLAIDYLSDVYEFAQAGAGHTGISRQALETFEKNYGALENFGVALDLPDWSGVALRRKEEGFFRDDMMPVLPSTPAVHTTASGSTPSVAAGLTISGGVNLNFYTNAESPQEWIRWFEMNLEDIRTKIIKAVDMADGGDGSGLVTAH